MAVYGASKCQPEQRLQRIGCQELRLGIGLVGDTIDEDRRELPRESVPQPCALHELPGSVSENGWRGRCCETVEKQRVKYKLRCIRRRRRHAHEYIKEWRAQQRIPFSVQTIDAAHMLQRHGLALGEACDIASMTVTPRLSRPRSP